MIWYTRMRFMSSLAEQPKCKEIGHTLRYMKLGDSYKPYQTYLISQILYGNASITCYHPRFIETTLIWHTVSYTVKEAQVAWK